MATSRAKRYQNDSQAVVQLAVRSVRPPRWRSRLAQAPALEIVRNLGHRQLKTGTDPEGNPGWLEELLSLLGGLGHAEPWTIQWEHDIHWQEELHLLE